MRRGAPSPQPSPARGEGAAGGGVPSGDEARPDSGYTLLEATAALAILALIAGFALPRFPLATSRPALEAYALRAATLLKADHLAAIRRRDRVDTSLDVDGRRVVSGSGAGDMQLPDDVALKATLADTCEGRRNGAAIAFLANGMSCGGALALSRPGVELHVRVNWLTGGVEIVAADLQR